MLFFLKCNNFMNLGRYEVEKFVGLLRIDPDNYCDCGAGQQCCSAAVCILVLRAAAALNCSFVLHPRRERADGGEGAGGWRGRRGVQAAILLINSTALPARSCSKLELTD